MGLMDYNQRILYQVMRDKCVVLLFGENTTKIRLIYYVTFLIDVMPQGLLDYHGFENVCYYVIRVGYQGKICKDLFFLLLLSLDIMNTKSRNGHVRGQCQSQNIKVNSFSQAYCGYYVIATTLFRSSSVISLNRNGILKNNSSVWRYCYTENKDKR